MDILAAPTDPAWLPAALADFDAVLIDHAHCERKAAASAMSLVNAYPDHPELVRRCVGLAQEELRHFKQVYSHLTARGLALPRDHGDPYAQALRKLVRQGEPARQLDLLLVASLIEARSCERLALLAGGLHDDPTLERFYTALAAAEAGHHALFVRLACRVAPEAEVRARLTDLAAREADLLRTLPVLPRIH